jgi:hypothetical protein
VTHSGSPGKPWKKKGIREHFTDWRGDLPLPEFLATKRQPLDPVRSALVLTTLPLSCLAAAFAPGWQWWQRILALLAALALSTHPTLLLIGYRRLRRRRKSVTE